MSLKITDHNHAVVGIAYSCRAWANHAVAADKLSGPEGFENFRSGDWLHYIHYKNISSNPEVSPQSALEEMSNCREKLVSDILKTAVQIDQMVMRLQRMEEQMKEVIEYGK